MNKTQKNGSTIQRKKHSDVYNSGLITPIDTTELTLNPFKTQFLTQYVNIDTRFRPNLYTS